MKKMSESDQDKLFWKLPDANSLDNQDDFYSHLKTSDHLTLAIYRPDKLTRGAPGRTQRVEGKTFERVSFSKTEIVGIIFRNCKFLDCQFIGSKLVQCEFHDCEFVRSNTHKIEFERTYIDPISFKKCLVKDKHQNIGVHLYQALLNNSRDEEQIEFEREAQFLFLRWKRYQETYEFRESWKRISTTRSCRRTLGKGWSVLGRLLWEKLFGCGIKLRYYIGTVTTTVLVATLLNFHFRVVFGLSLDEQIITSLSEAFYFTTVSLTTLGYGDITPTTDAGRLASSLQSVVGLSLFALLASMLFRKVSP